MHVHIGQLNAIAEALDATSAYPGAADVHFNACRLFANLALTRMRAYR